LADRRIIAIDPGVETGYCYAKIDHNGYVRYFPFQMTEDVDDLWRRLKEFKPDIIVMEDFDFRGGHHRAATGVNYFPLQLIGVARLYSLVEPTGRCAIYMQKAAQGKSYYSDVMLKNRNLYKRGKPHAMDASRHLLQWLTFGAGFKWLTKDQNFARLLDAWGDEAYIA
jgi:hypothetical protein